MPHAAEAAAASSVPMSTFAGLGSSMEKKRRAFSYWSDPLADRSMPTSVNKEWLVLVNFSPAPPFAARTSKTIQSRTNNNLSASLIVHYKKMERRPQKTSGVIKGKIKDIAPSFYVTHFSILNANIKGAFFIHDWRHRSRQQQR